MGRGPASSRRSVRGPGSRGREVGLVSVVVVVEPGDRVEECLASVRGQTHGQLEAVVCPVGAAAAALPDDPRFRVRPSSGSWFDAANHGIEAAVGDYVVLLRGCDQLPSQALEALAGSLAVTGSDLVSGVLEQAGEPEPWLRRAQADSHDEASTAHPVRAEQAADLGLANKAFTRDVARRLRLVETDDWLCSPTLAHLLPAATLDVLDRPVARWSPDRGHRAYGARPSPLPLLEDALLRRDLVTAAVVGSVLADGWLRHWYDVLLPRFVADAERADDATWLRLVELVHAPRDVELRAASRSLLWLTGQGRRDDVEALAAELASLGDDVPTELTEDGVPLARWRSVDVPADARRLAEVETRLRVRVVRSRAVPEGRRVDLFVRVEGVDLARAPAAGDGRGRRSRARRGPLAATSRRTDGRRRVSSRPPRAPCGSTVPQRLTRLTLTARAGIVERSDAVDVPSRAPARLDAPGPRVEDVTLDGDRLVVHLDAPADGLRLRGPGHRPRRRAAARRHRRLRDAARPLRPPGAAPDRALPPAPRRRSRRRPGLARTAPGRERRRPAPAPRPPRRRRSRRAPPRPTRADDELGAYGQERLRASYAVDERPTDPGLWYFESFAGRSATDTPPRRLRRAAPPPARAARRAGAIARPRALDARGCDAGRDRHPRVVRRAGHGPGAWWPTPSWRSGTAGGPTSSSCSASTATRPRRMGESQWLARELPAEPGPR